MNQKNELKKRIQDYDIMVLTETKCNNNKNIYIHIYFSEYKTYQKESIGNNGGIAICVRNNIEFDIIKEWQQIGNEFDVIGIRTKNTMERLNIIAIYRRPIYRRRVQYKDTIGRSYLI